MWGTKLIKKRESPAKGKKCVECSKIGHYAKCCRSSREINHVMEEEAYSAGEDDWRTDRIHSIQQKIHSLGTNGKNGPLLYTATLLVNDRPIKFLIPNHGFISDSQYKIKIQ